MAQMSFIRLSGKYRTRSAILLFSCAALVLEAAAQGAFPGAPAQNAQQHRLQIDEASARVVERPALLTPDPASGASASTGFPVFPAEAPCFNISGIDWRGIEAFPWLRERFALDGQCLGAQGLQVARRAIARALLTRGYVTTLVIVPEQDLSKGRLTVEVVAGRIGRMRDEGDSIGWYGGALQVAPGDLLNLRDLDQALENVRRLPGQGTATLALLPGLAPGLTDIILQHPENASRVRGVLTAENAGVDATGRSQLGGVVSIDSPLGLYDQLIATFSSDSHLYQRKKKGSTAASIAWNVPVGYASFSIGASEWASRQSLQIFDVTSPYAARTRRFDAGVSFVPYRSSHSKGSLRFTLFRRQENAWLENEMLDVQRRDTTGFEVGVGHLEKLGDATLEFGAGWRASLAGASRFPGHVHGHRNWNGRYRVATASASASVPFDLGSQQLGYRGSVLVQHTFTPMPASEYLQLGGRQTVRGFDGNATLTAPGGWLLRNELALSVFAATEAYVAVDAGGVSGGSNARRHARRLAGMALGVRGSAKGFGYDLSVGAPIARPEGFESRKPFLNFLFTTSF